MTVFRSYFSKNNTLISDNYTNNSQNPVTEVSYGTLLPQISRYIFDIDFTNLLEKIQQGIYNRNNIVGHRLVMTNTIAFRPDLIGSYYQQSEAIRTSGIKLDVFNILEKWDGGNGYVFSYYQDVAGVSLVPSNWFKCTALNDWTNLGAYKSGVNQIIGTQNFEKGNEDLSIDITDYVNFRLFGSTSGSTITESYGLGVKFPDEYESLLTENRNVIGFYAKNTNTYYEPYVETIFDDQINDSRNSFFLNQDNDLYWFGLLGKSNIPHVVNSVSIYDFEGDLIETITGSSIQKGSNGSYYVTINVDGDVYPDGVLFNDVWDVTINGQSKTFNKSFYLISDNLLYSGSLVTEQMLDNYYFTFTGIKYGEKITSGSIRQININTRQLYPVQDDMIPINVEYRLYCKLGNNYEIDIIPFTAVNRIEDVYAIFLDTSWLIAQDYWLELRVGNGIYYETKQSINFKIINILKK